MHSLLLLLKDNWNCCRKAIKVFFCVKCIFVNCTLDYALGKKASGKLHNHNIMKNRQNEATAHAFSGGFVKRRLCVS